jgi:hypothetical protein
MRARCQILTISPSRVHDACDYTSASLGLYRDFCLPLVWRLVEIGRWWILMVQTLEVDRVGTRVLLCANLSLLALVLVPVVMVGWMLQGGSRLAARRFRGAMVIKAPSSL